MALREKVKAGGEEVPKSQGKGKAAVSFSGQAKVSSSGDPKKDSSADEEEEETFVDWKATSPSDDEAETEEEEEEEEITNPNLKKAKNMTQAEKLQMDKEGHENAKQAMKQVSLDSDDEAKLAKSAKIVAKSGVHPKHQAEIARAHKNVAIKGKARAAADKPRLDAGNSFGRAAHTNAKTAGKPRKPKKAPRD